MKTDVADTSLEAYIKEQPQFLSQEMRVLACIRANPNTYDREIGLRIKMESSTVAARRNSLFNAGLIKKGNKVKSKYSGNTVQGWLINGDN